MRHGESLANAGLSDDLDSPLTPRGERQAEIAAEWLVADAHNNGPFTKALVSPFRRTLQTYRPIGHALGIDAEVYPDVCEYFHVKDQRYDSLEGLSEPDIRNIVPTIQIPHGGRKGRSWGPSVLEDTHAIRSRGARVREQLLERYQIGNVRLLIVSHAEPIGRIVEALLALPASDHAPWTENCAIWRIRVNTSDTPGTSLLENYQGHLAKFGLDSVTTWD